MVIGMALIDTLWHFLLVVCNNVFILLPIRDGPIITFTAYVLERLQTAEPIDGCIDVEKEIKINKAIDR